MFSFNRTIHLEDFIWMLLLHATHIFFFWFIFLFQCCCLRWLFSSIVANGFFFCNFLILHLNTLFGSVLQNDLWSKSAGGTEIIYFFYYCLFDASMWFAENAKWNGCFGILGRFYLWFYTFAWCIYWLDERMYVWLGQSCKYARVRQICFYCKVSFIVVNHMLRLIYIDIFSREERFS